MKPGFAIWRTRRLVCSPGEARLKWPAVGKHDYLRSQVTDARDGPQLADRVTERVKIAIHLGVDLGDGGVE